MSLSTDYCLAESAAYPAAPAGQSERKTKIVCTLGPSSEQLEQVRRLIDAGANIFRLNFSHADHDWHTKALQIVRREAEAAKQPVAVMQDLCGPKIRLSRVIYDDYHAVRGDTIRITTEHHLQQSGETSQPPQFDVATNYASLPEDVVVDGKILLDDGRIELVVEEIRSGVVSARVTRGGRIEVGKGLNLPGVALSTDSMTSKDWLDLQWGIEHEVDFVALSFVRHPDDLIGVRDRLDKAGSNARLIAKIERPEAIEHIERIIELSDGLMVARGDLGLETDLAQVPILQKHLIQRCRDAAKPVITATQMLESMVNDSTPTRAEISDVANAIFDGSDAIMLSGETAVGQFPTEAVEVLHRVALVTEADLARRFEVVRRRGTCKTTVGAITEAAAISAVGQGARRVVVYSQTGYTAKMMARYRLPMPVVAVTNVPATYLQLNLSYGVQPLYMPEIVNMTQMLAEMDQLAIQQRWGTKGDVLVVVSALDGRDGNIDTLHIHHVKG